MRNYIKLFSLVVALLMTFCVSAQAETLLDGKKWTDVNTVSNGGGGTIQGAAYYNGKIYQLTNGGSYHGVYDVASGSWSAGGAMNNGYLAKSHFGSACFGPESTKTYTVNGTQHTSAYPLLYVTAHDKTSGSRALLVNVIDYEQKTLVASIRLKDTGTQDDQIAAYDFAGGKLYLMGYVGNVTGMAPWVIREYSGFSFNNFTTTSQTVETIENVPVVDMTSATYTTTQVGGPNSEGIQENLVAGTLQDCQYVDGKIYFVVTRGSRYSRTEWMRVHCYDVATKQVVKTVCSAVNCEPEGFVYDGNGSFYVTTGGEGTEGKSRLFKLSEGSGYDALNFEPAPLVDGYYQISNASQFVWFKQQVYSGCTTIKAKLMNDISMSGQKDPYTYYVYDTSAESGSAQKFDATYAFRGEFDGNNHAISNVSITSTPHYNDGLFPYVEGAYIHDLSVAGTITATKSTDKAASTDIDVKNVGMIGTINGGTLENINVSGLTVSVTDGLTSENVGTLYGREIGNVTLHNITGITTYTITFLDDDNTTKIQETDVIAGHEIIAPANPAREGYTFAGWNPAFDSGTTATANATYVATYNESPYDANGFRRNATSADADYYETPSLVDGYYQIKNAGNMYWFANSINGTNGYTKIDATSNAKLMKDIDMGGSAAGNFPGIGVVNTTIYKGVFDGQGNTISNYYMNINHGSSRSGLFTTIGGTSTKHGVVKNFKISGTTTYTTGTQAMHGTVVGEVCAYGDLLDVTSSVTFKNSKAFALQGGIAGSILTNGTIQRCRYNGAIEQGLAKDRIGGIVGELRGGLVKDCLFDGTITNNQSGAKIGGIAGGCNGTSSTISNCLSVGTITVSAVSSTIGPISATSSNISVDKAYYTTTLASGYNTTGTIKGSLTWSDIKNNLNDSRSPEVWGINSQEYPVPGEQDATPVTKYTITFNDWDGTQIQQTQVKEGAVITAPADPTRTGHKFTGWDPTFTAGTTATKDETYTAQYSVNQYTITFDTQGGSTIPAITQDYGTSVTAPADPTKDGYDFAGWDKEIPKTMPAESITITAQWTEKQYTITFDTQGGSAIAPITQVAGTPVTAPADPTRYGYRFTGWDKEIPTVMPAEDITITASWEEISTEGYTNGFSNDPDATGIDRYQEALNDGDYYIIDNGGKLFWFATYVNSQPNGAVIVNAKITKDIDLENRNFPIMGDSQTKYFGGIFDGQGYTIKNFSQTISGGIYRSGMFSCLKGTNNTTGKAIVMNFTLEGTKSLGSTNAMHGVVVGDVWSYALVEDVICKVDLETTTQKSMIGGMFGTVQTNGVVNRCVYSGNITGVAYDRIGGIVGELRGGTISNCLFNGSLTCNSGGSNRKVGGIAASTSTNDNSCIKNCYVKGVITLDGFTSGSCGYIFGTAVKTITISDTYYSTTNSTSLSAIGADSNVTQNKVADATSMNNDDLLAVLKENKGEWKILNNEVVPGIETCSHQYNKYGYCTKCNSAEPIGDVDAEGYYSIDHLADLVSFRRMVAAATKGTEINAKVTADIDVTGLDLEWTDLIGDEAHPYCGTFDGQGHSFKGLNASSDKRYVGVFACVGIKDSDASKCKEGIVKNFSVSGDLTATYFSKWNTNTPLCMGVIGEIYNGTVENVHSSVNFHCTSGTRSHIGGVVGGSLHMSGDAGEIVIKNCSYTGTIDVNASDCIGGIVGYAQHKTKISNTLYAGSIKQDYERPANEEDGSEKEGPVSTYIGGVLGYCNSTSNGVKNSIILGDMESNLTDFETTEMKHKKNNMNICVGFDGQINATKEEDNSAKNYYGNYITPEMKKKYHQLPSDKFSGTANVYKAIDFASGIVCAKLNADPSAENDPWGQILGYQVGYDVNGDGNLVREGRFDPNSPAQPYPFPGYTDPEQTSYKVVQTENAETYTDSEGNTKHKYDYTADYYFFDDFGDTTPIPSDAASMHVNYLEYTRKANYMGGYCSFILPFDFTADMKPNDDVKFYKYERCDNDALVVTFTEISLPIAKGTPFILYNPGSASDWVRELENVDIAIKEGNPTAMTTAEGTTKLNNGKDLAEGLYGTFNTIHIDSGYWKIKGDGSKLVYTNENSDCFPFRCFLKLPYVHTGSSSAAPRYTPVFEDAPEAIDQIVEDADNMGEAPCYNLQGQMVDDLSRAGIYIVGGKTIMVK